MDCINDRLNIKLPVNYVFIKTSQIFIYICMFYFTSLNLCKKQNLLYIFILFTATILKNTLMYNVPDTIIFIYLNLYLYHPFIS